MNSNKVFSSGMLAGVFFMMAAQAGNWLITPMSHPDASALRKGAVVAQAIVCLGISLWLMWRQRSSVAVAV